jgi:L-amino acid N-acyltransferase YncA
MAREPSMLARPGHTSLAPPLPLTAQQYHSPMRIRLASSGDAEAIRSIYNAEVLESINTFDMVPRTRDEQAAWLAEHQGVHPVIVATEPAEAGTDGDRGANGEVILGFGSLSAFRDRPGYAATAENSIYVDRLQRGKGVGRALLAELLELAAAHGFHSVIARVAGHNEVSVGLHRAAGFELVGVEREVGRKHRQWLDVVELQRLL